MENSERFVIHLNMEDRKEEEALTLDAIFPTVEDFIGGQKVEDKDYQCPKKRKFDDDKFAGNLDILYTPQWREAVIRFAENKPMSLLIQEFERYYYKAASNKRTSKGTSDEESAKTLDVKRKRNDGQIIDIPADILENIFLRISLFDLLASRLVCNGWGTVYASRYFRSVCDKTDRCIAINNHNLDIWAFCIPSKRWFEIKVPCDWDKLGMKTLGLRASCDGLFLVARSDFTLFVVNPLICQYRSLRRIYPHGIRDHDKSLRSLIVDGTAEMQVSRDTGDYTISLFGNFDHQGTSYVHIARYISTTDLWTIRRIHFDFNDIPLQSRNFPSPLSSFCRRNVISCFSARCGRFQVYNPPVDYPNFEHNVTVRDMMSNIPATIDFELRRDEIDYKNNPRPTIVPFNDRQIMVGKVKRNGSTGQIYGKLPIIRHSALGLWQCTQFGLPDIETNWEMIDTMEAELLEHMVKSSEGTDFLVVGDGSDSIWFLLRGSEKMLEYRISSKQWLFYDSACPGGGYLDASFHWKALFASLRFNALVR